MRRDGSTAMTAGATLTAVLAVVCCAGLPAMGVLADGITIGAVLGAGGALLAIATLVGLATLAVRRWRPRGCPPPHERTPQ